MTGRNSVSIMGARGFCRIFEVPEKNVEHIKQTQGLVESFPGIRAAHARACPTVQPPKMW